MPEREPNQHEEYPTPEDLEADHLESATNPTYKRSMTPEEVYGLTRNEQLFDRVSDVRFREIISQVETLVHEMQVSANNWGEFLFVSTSRVLENECHRLTFWGCGFHELRERWISEEWFFYRGHPSAEREENLLSDEEIQAQLESRLVEMPAPSATQMPSQRGQLFEVLADLMDEDGAWAELDDMDDLLSDLD